MRIIFDEFWYQLYIGIVISQWKGRKIVSHFRIPSLFLFPCPCQRFFCSICFLAFCWTGLSRTSHRIKWRIIYRRRCRWVETSRASERTRKSAQIVKYWMKLLLVLVFPFRREMRQHCQMELSHLPRHHPIRQVLPHSPPLMPSKRTALSY